MQQIKFSVIIPLQKCNDFLEENINALLKGSYQNFEILVLPDAKEKKTYSKTKIIPTGNVGPAEKRDIGAKMARGEILAFIDDDAYPSKDWLKNALKIFEETKVSAVCGPGVTPPSDSLFQKISGVFSSTLLGGGPYGYRFVAQKEREVDDYPSMNFLIKRNDFFKVEGFDTAYWPGEDTKLCLDLTKKYKKRIFYHPSVLVYHHRRGIFKQHLLQNGRYGIHRGYFARVLPKTSFRISYFFPSVLLMSILLLPFLAIVYKPLFFTDSLAVSVYLLLVVVTAVFVFIKEKSIAVAILLIPTIISTHLFYGLRFIQGFFFTKSLKSKLRGEISLS